MIAVAVIALLNSVVSLYYYIRVLKHMYLTKATDTTPEVKPSFGNTVLVLVFAVPVLYFGIFWEPIVNAAKSCLVILGM